MTDLPAPREAEQDARPEHTFLVVNVGEELFATEITAVQEILKEGRVFPVPEAPEPVVGVLNLRGQVVTVLSGHRLLGVEKHLETEAPRILVVEREGDLLGVRVDRVAGVVRVAEANVLPPVESTRPSGAVFAGNFHMGGNVVNLLNLRETLEGRLAGSSPGGSPPLGVDKS